MRDDWRFLVLMARQMAVFAVSTMILNFGSPSGEKNRQESGVQKKPLRSSRIGTPMFLCRSLV